MARWKVIVDVNGDEYGAVDAVDRIEDALSNLTIDGDRGGSNAEPYMLELAHPVEGMAPVSILVTVIEQS